MVSSTEYLPSSHAFVCLWLDVTCIRIPAKIVTERAGDDVMMDEITGINISMFCDLFLFSLSLYRSVARGITEIVCHSGLRFEELLWISKFGALGGLPYLFIWENGWKRGRKCIPLRSWWKLSGYPSSLPLNPSNLSKLTKNNLRLFIFKFFLASSRREI